MRNQEFTQGSVVVYLNTQPEDTGEQDVDNRGEIPVYDFLLRTVISIIHQPDHLFRMVHYVGIVELARVPAPSTSNR